MRQYEGMFIFDPTFASDFKNVEQEIDRIMKRADGEIIVNRKWDERKLAYEINKRKRGCYVLTYFKADPDRITRLERDCALSDHILRVMVLRVDDMSRERMEAMYPQRRATTPVPDTGSEGKPAAGTVKKDSPAAETVKKNPPADAVPDSDTKADVDVAAEAAPVDSATNVEPSPEPTDT